MLSPEQNEKLTQVSPGTPMGNLMRRHWHLVAATEQLDSHPVKEVRLLGESLVLYRDLQGRFGLLAETCPHRGASLAWCRHIFRVAAQSGVLPVVRIIGQLEVFPSVGLSLLGPFRLKDADDPLAVFVWAALTFPQASRHV